MPPPRRRDHVDAAPAPVLRHGSYADAAAAVRHGGYADAEGAPGARHGYGAAAAPAGRRTIEIRGRTVPAPVVPRTPDVDRRRPPRRAVERVGSRPDRLALWALVMGLVLILVAVTTADAATVAAVAGY
jgi:hypothetical protein